MPLKTESVRKASKSKEDFDINDYPMFGRIISADLTLKNSVQLLNDKHEIRRNRNLANINHFLPEDDEHVLMNVIRRERLAQYKVNINTGKSKFVTVGGKLTSGYVNDIEGTPRFRYDYLHISKAVKIYEYHNEEDWRLIDTIYFDDESESKNNVSLKGLMGLYNDQLVYRKQNNETGYYELVLIPKANTDTAQIKETQNQETQNQESLNKSVASKF